MTGGGHAYPAPGKLNLMLRVVGRRADGYHLLQTVFRYIDRADSVWLNVRHDGAIVRTADLPGVPEDQDLSVRAARALKAATGTALGAEIALTKTLPAGGGLGGGSSDAATTLIVLNHLWKTGLARPELMRLGLELGADVPAFVFGEASFGEGVGERLTAIALPAAWYVVLTPPVAVPTATVFAHPELKRDSKMITIQSFSAGIGADGIGVDQRGPVNDLQALVCREYPEVARHLEWLQQHGRAAMTGSGSSVFAAFGSEREARAVLERLPPTMSGFVARGLDRHPLHRLVAQ
jgi:4-diphosphocytidyl-2-C-methyl-D-erythritol kinase